jgi:hypothetical protein
MHDFHLWRWRSSGVSKEVFQQTTKSLSTSNVIFVATEFVAESKPRVSIFVLFH